MQNPKTETVEASAPRFLSKDKLLALLDNVAYSTVWGWMREQGFPLPIELGKPDGRTTKIVWLADEVYAWIAARPRRRIGHLRRKTEHTKPQKACADREARE